jgi:hypothetical protein
LKREMFGSALSEANGSSSRWNCTSWSSRLGEDAANPEATASRSVTRRRRDGTFPITCRVGVSFTRVLRRHQAVEDRGGYHRNSRCCRGNGSSRGTCARSSAAQARDDATGSCVKSPPAERLWRHSRPGGSVELRPAENVLVSGIMWKSCLLSKFSPVANSGGFSSS